MRQLKKHPAILSIIHVCNFEGKLVEALLSLHRADHEDESSEESWRLTKQPCNMFASCSNLQLTRQPATAQTQGTTSPTRLEHNIGSNTKAKCGSAKL